MRRIGSTSSSETERLGELVGSNLRGGEVIELAGDIGGGKTTFVRGLARGAGSSDVVSSPTFTISKQYSADKLTIYHLDFYRLQESGLMKYDLHDLLKDPKIVVVVEWANVVHGVLPTSRLIIKFKTTDLSSRQLILSGPKRLEYLLEGVK